MGRKKSRQTFEKMKREQRVRERRERKEERKEASRIAKALGLPAADEIDTEQPATEPAGGTRGPEATNVPTTRQEAQSASSPAAAN